MSPLLHRLFESPLVDRLGWTLLHSLWQGAAVAAALSLVLIALRRHGPRPRYLAACGAMALLAALPAATFLLVRPAPRAQPIVADAGGAAALAPSQSSAAQVDRGHEPLAAMSDEERPRRSMLPGAADPRFVFPFAGPMPESVDASRQKALAPVVSQAAPAPADVIVTTSDALRSALPWAVAVWVAGVLMLSVWNLGGWVAVQRLKGAATESAGPALQATAARLARRLGLARPVLLRLSQIAESPLVVGAIRPVILLPASLVTGLPPAHLEALLAHELAHIARRDYLVNLLQAAVETLLFYHPATWWVSKTVRAEREHCCDDLAVAVTCDRSEYVRALAAVAEAGLRAPALTLGATSGSLVARIRRLLGRPDATATPRPSRWLAAAALTGLCAVAGILTAGPLASTNAAQPTTKPAAVAEPPTTAPAGRGVLLVTEGNFFLERALRAALPGRELTIVKEVKYDADGPGGAAAVVFDALQPKRLPGVPALYFGAMPPGSDLPGEDGGRVDPAAAPKGVKVTDWQRDHALLARLPLDGLWADSVLPLRSPLPQGWQVVAQAGASPLIVASAGNGPAARAVVVTFPTSRSNWPLKASFSAFVFNAVGWLAPADAAGAPAATRPTAPATQSAEAREVLLRVVHAQTGQPVPVSRAGVTIDEAGFQLFSSDERGEVRLPYPSNAKRLRISLTKDGFVGTDAALGARDARLESGANQAIPAEHTIRLRPGVSVSGVVHDEAGKPVADARVSPSFEFDDPDKPGRRNIAHGDATTDAEGRWTTASAPPETNDADVFVRHPDFVLDSFSQPSRGPATFEAMRKGTHVSTIRRGVSFTGIVLDPEGKPVVGAEVGPDGFGLISSVVTDTAGRFRLRGVEPGKRSILAKSDHFAPQVREVTTSPDADPIEFRLEKGLVLRAQVVDENGNPVPDAYVSVQTWGEQPPTERETSYGRGFAVGRTGPDGRLTWSGAPAGPLTMRVYRQDRPELTGLPATAGGTDEYHWVLRSYPKFEGTVTDEAGAPIVRGKVRVTARWSKNTLSSQWDLPIADGTFAGPVRSLGDTYTLRAEAEGYLPSESPALPHPDGNAPIKHAFRLKLGAPTVGVVLRPDGKPAAGAEVMMIDGTYPQSMNGVFESWAKRSNPTVATDAAGRFALPPRGGEKPSELVIIHEAGWTEAPHAGGALQEPLTLRAWCTVSGVLMKGDKPWAGQAVELRIPISVPNGRGGYGKNTTFRSASTTDAEGRFTLSRIADGDAQLTAGGQSLSLRLKPGDRVADARIGGSGRPAIGIAKVPESAAKQNPPRWSGSLRLVEPRFVKPANWEALPKEERQRLRDAFQQTPEYLRYASGITEIQVPRAADGSFRMEDVPPGDYMLFLSVQAPTPGEPSNYRALALADVRVVVPEVPGGRSELPLDLGAIEMKAVNHELKVGDAAPPIDAKTLDGKPLRLSDFKGKYVLLDFWATWCEPCIAEQPMLRGLHDAHAAGGQFVIISLSRDDDAATAAAFVKARGLPWVQGHVGTGSGSSAEQDYGVQGIPSTWLIDPDGKIIAKNLHGGELKAAVEKSLP